MDIDEEIEKIERDMLCSLILKPELIDGLGLAYENFFNKNYAKIFYVLTQIRKRGIHIDSISIFNMLMEKNQLEAVGGAVAISEILEFGNLLKNPERTSNNMKVATEFIEKRYVNYQG